MTSDIISVLAATIDARRASDAGQSYTRQLLDQGPDHCARKFGEEAVELVIAAVRGDKTEITAEAADAIYHLLVLLTSSDVAWHDVAAKLEARMGVSGLVEKASRPVMKP